MITDTVWWPSIISDIEKTQFKPVQIVQWWRRIQLECHYTHWSFRGNPGNAYILIVQAHSEIMILIDAYNKWPEIYAMSVTTAQATIQQLCKIFAVHGLPELLITDNDPEFVASKCESFCQAREIHHTRRAPYYPR